MTDLALIPLGVLIGLAVFVALELAFGETRQSSACEERLRVRRASGFCEPCRVARWRRSHACEGVLCTCRCGEEKEACN